MSDLTLLGAQILFNVLRQALDVDLQLAERTPRDVLETVNHVQVYVLPIYLFGALI